MTDTPIDVSALTPEAKRALLARLLMQKAERSASEHPLSQGQRSLWFVHQLAPDSAAYTVVYAGRISGVLDTAALERAAQALVDRHPMLRTTYTERDRQPCQLVHPSWPVRIAHHDIGTDPAEVQSWIRRETDRPFDLYTGPVLRLTLLRRGPEEHILVLAVHHIAVDFWSIDIILDELRRLYAAEHGGPVPRCPPSVTSTTPRIRRAGSTVGTGNGCGPTGVSGWPGICPPCSCPPTGPDRPCRPTAVRCTDSRSTPQPRPHSRTWDAPPAPPRT